MRFDSMAWDLRSSTDGNGTHCTRTRTLVHRLAMIGFLTGAVVEVQTAEPLAQQAMHMSPVAGLLLLLVVYASLVPILKGVKNEAFGTSACVQPPSNHQQQGCFRRPASASTRGRPCWGLWSCCCWSRAQACASFDVCYLIVNITTHHRVNYLWPPAARPAATSAPSQRWAACPGPGALCHGVRAKHVHCSHVQQRSSNVM